MAVNLGSAYAEIGLDVSGVERAAKAAQSSIARISDSLKSAGSSISSFGASLSIGITAPLALVSKSVIDAASDIAETQSKIGAIFGDSADAVRAFAETSAESFGQSTQAALDAAATFATFGKGAGLAGDDLVGFSSQLTTLASDLASFSNTSPEQAIEAIGAALRGESEPIRAYGILLDDATLKARALALGIYDGTDSLTQQQRVLAAQAEILAQTSDAQGDFARTSEGLANQQRILSARLDNLRATLGSALLPVALQVTSVFQGLVTKLQSLAERFASADPKIQKIVIAIGAVVAAAGPLLVVVGGIVSAIGSLVAAAGTVVAVMGSPLALAIAGAVAGITLLVDSMGGIGAVIDTAVSSLSGLSESLTDRFRGGIEGLMNDMFSWGAETINQFALGIESAVGSITNAVQPIIDAISYWFQPNSPPKVAPDIDQWGASTMGEYLKGFSLADFSLLESVESELANFFKNITPDPKAFNALSEQINKASADLVGFVASGGSSTEAMNRLSQSLQGIPTDIQAVIVAEIDLSTAHIAVETAQKSLEQATDGVSRAQEAMGIAIARAGESVAQAQAVLDASTESLTTAQDKLTLSQEALTQAQEAGALAVERAQSALTQAQESASQAQERLNRVSADYDAILSPLNDKLEGLRGKLADVSAEFEKAISPLNAQLDAIDQQSKAIKDRQRIQEIDEKLSKGGLTADQEKLLVLEKQRIAISAQIDEKRRQEQVSTDAVKAEIATQEQLIKQQETAKKEAIKAESAKIAVAKEGVKLAQIALATEQERVKADLRSYQSAVAQNQELVKQAQRRIDLDRKAVEEAKKGVEAVRVQQQQLVDIEQEKADKARESLAVAQEAEQTAKNELDTSKAFSSEIQKQNDLLRERVQIAESEAKAQESKRSGGGGIGKAPTITPPDVTPFEKVNGAVAKTSQLLGEVSEKSGSAFDKLASVVSSLLAPGLNSFSASLAIAVEKLPALQSAFDGLITSGKELLTAIAPIATAIGGLVATGIVVGINGLIALIGKALPVAIDILTVAIDGMSSVVSSVAEVIAPISDRLTAFISRVMSGDDVITALSDAIGVDLYGAIETIKGAFTTVSGVVSDLFGGTIETAREAIGSFSAKLPELVATFSPLIDAIKNFRVSAEPAFLAVNDAFLTVGKVVAEVVAGIVAVMGGVLIATISGLVSAVATAMPYIASIITGAITAVTGVINTFSAVISLVTGAITGNNDLLVQSWTRLKDGVTSILTGLSEIVKSLFTGIVDTGTSLILNFVDTLLGYFDLLIEGITGKGSDLSESVAGILADAKATALDLAGSFVEIGSAIVDGIVSAIKSGAGAIVGAITSAIQSAISAAKNALGIKSPSKVMIEMFGYVIDGAVIALERGASPVMVAAEKIAQSVTDALSISPVITPSVATASAMGGTLTSMANGGSNSQQSPAELSNRLIESKQAATPQPATAPQPVTINFGAVSVRNETDMRLLAERVANEIARGRKQ